MTAAAFVATSVAAQAILRSGTCSKIFACHCLRTPAISATHSRRSSFSCVALKPLPLVVRRAYWQIDKQIFLNPRRHDIPLSRGF
jgi:hypothetical protein